MSKKQKKTKEWKRRQKRIKDRERTRQAIISSQERLLDQTRKNAIQKGDPVQIDRNNPQKMSEVILDFAEPLLDTAHSIEDQRKATSMAITFWNISLLPNHKRNEFIKYLINTVNETENSAKLSEDKEQVIRYFVNRKEAFFFSYK
ncbi:MAG: hypothetical protein OEV64_12685 [Desulfobulbaceae bacterium]|nr:hypothetical protein [Desulfobulbaceae bacterium]